MTGKKRPLRRRRKAFRPVERPAEQGSSRLGRLRRQAGGILLVVLLLAGGISAVGSVLHLRAAHKAELLQQALDAGNWDRVPSLKDGAGTFLYSLFHDRLKHELQRAELWEKRQAQACRLLQRRLAEVRQGHLSPSSLRASELAEVERALRELSPSCRHLGEEWQELCRREQEQLEKRRQEVVLKLRSELLPEAELCGEPERDSLVLRRRLEQVEEQKQRWLDARDAYHLPQEELQPILRQEEHTRCLLKEATAMQHLLSRLPQTRHYGQYLVQMRQTTASAYPPARRWMSIVPRLPEESELLRAMQAFRLGLPLGKLEHLRSAHLQRGATFSPACPATQKQVHLMERVFSCHFLLRVLAEWENGRGEHCFVEEAPRRTSHHILRLTRSDLDPEYSLSRSPSLLWNEADSRQVRRVDVAALLRECGIRRETFFRELNLAEALGKIVRYEREDCPALARAWLYGVLLDVMQAHPSPKLMGLACSSSLREDGESFRQIRSRCRIQLNAGCWLSFSREVQQAEEAFLQWFRERRHRDYAGEISRRMSSLLRVYPLYVGYVNEEGKAVFCRDVPPRSLLWYLSEGELIQTPEGAPLHHPSPLSPILIAETAFPS